MKKIICALTALIASVCLCLGLSMFFTSPTEVKADGLVETFYDFETETDSENFGVGYKGWKIRDGKYYASTDWASVYYKNELTGDFVIDFDASLGTSAVRYALFPSEDDKGNKAIPDKAKYYVLISSSLSATVFSGGTASSNVLGAKAITQADEYHFTFIYSEEKLTLVVNNQTLFSDLVGNVTAPSKYFAIQTEGTTNYIDNFRVKKFNSIVDDFIFDDSTQYEFTFVDGGEQLVKTVKSWAGVFGYNKKLSGNFSLSFTLNLYPHLNSAGGAFRIALFTTLKDDGTFGDIERSGDYYLYEISEQNTYVSGNSAISDIARGTTDGDIRTYKFKMTYAFGKLYTWINDTLYINGQSRNISEGYLAFRSMRIGDTISGITYTELNINNDGDIEAAGQFGDKATSVYLPKDNNVVIKTTGAWTVAYYQEKLSGNFEISYDLFLGSNIEGANSQPVRIGLMVPTASGTLEGRAGSYYFYINATGIKLYSHDGNDTDRTAAFNNPGIIKKDGTANKYSILFRYVNNSLSIMVNNQLILNNYKNDAFTATEGYFGVQYQYTDEYMDNFKVTKFTEANSKKLTYDGEETLIGYDIQGETYSGLYNFDTIYGNEVNNIKTTPITVKSYAMAAGASVRINSVNGIRWYSTISKAERELVEKYGAVFKTEISAAGQDEKVTITHKDGFNLVDDSYLIYATITNIKSNHYNLKMTAQAYIEIKYADGTVGRIDATTAKTERCYSEVVLNALKDVSTSESGNYKYAVKNDSSITGKEGETVYSCYGENVYEYLRSEYNKTLSDKEGE